MKKYFVSLMCVYSATVEADTPEEAADKVAETCPCDVDGLAIVTDMNTGEQYEA